MTFIRWCTEAFTFKHMAEMPTTSCACNFNPPSIWVRVTIYGSGKTIKESWPSTTRVKFSCGLVERSSTPSTGIDSLVIQLVVFPSAWVLGSFLPQNPKLLRRQNRPPLLIRFLNRPRCSHGCHTSPEAPLALREHHAKSRRRKCGCGAESEFRRTSSELGVEVPAGGRRLL